MKIFYIDDEKILLDVFSETIRSWGHEVDTFSCPKEALAKLEEQEANYDIALVDYAMPNTNGVDFIRELQQNDYFGINSVALFSALTWDKSVKEELIRKVPDAQTRIAYINKGPDSLSELKIYLKDKLPA